MKKEEILELFPEATEEQVAKLLEKHSAEIDEQKQEAEKQKKSSKAAEARAKEAEKELEDLKSNGLSETEKLQKENEKHLETIARLEREAVTAKVNSIFAESGMGADAYTPFSDVFSSLDEETAIAKAKAVVKSFTDARTATENRVKEEMLDNTPGGSGSGGGTEPKSDKDANAEIVKEYTKAKSEGMKASSDILSQYGLASN